MSLLQLFKGKQDWPLEYVVLSYCPVSNQANELAQRALVYIILTLACSWLANALAIDS